MKVYLECISRFIFLKKNDHKVKTHHADVSKLARSEAGARCSARIILSDQNHLKLLVQISQIIYLI